MIPFTITPGHLLSGVCYGALVGFLFGVAWAAYLGGKRHYIRRAAKAAVRVLFRVALWIDRALDR